MKGGEVMESKKNEYDVILEAYFDCKNPIHLRVFPKKESRRLKVLKVISQVFDYDVSYTEKEVNDLLRPVYDDFVLLRRYLVDYSLLERTNSGLIYRKKSFDL